MEDVKLKPGDLVTPSDEPETLVMLTHRIPGHGGSEVEWVGAVLLSPHRLVGDTYVQRDGLDWVDTIGSVLEHGLSQSWYTS